MLDLAHQANCCQPERGPCSWKPRGAQQGGGGGGALSHWMLFTCSKDLGEGKRLASFLISEGRVEGGEGTEESAPGGARWCSAGAWEALAGSAAT